MMKRKFWKTLVSWKNSDNRKPLLLQGARQTGKTWILKEFGKQMFEDYILLDFAEDPALNDIFLADLKPDRILIDLSVYLGRDISFYKTFIIFDEIQRCPLALTSLKYFYEKYPGAYIAASGSLLGIGLSTQDFPVGKVQREWLRPLCFFEFLDALGENNLNKYLSDAAQKQTTISPAIHHKTFELFKEFLIVGGLPEVVKSYVDLRNKRVHAFRTVRKMQRELVQSYLDDIAKHSGDIKAVRIAGVFNNIPDQLAREVSGGKKFVFKNVLPGRSTYDVLAGPIEWLIKAGLIHKVPVCRKILHPMSAYCEQNTFVIYLFDTGILGAMLRLDPAVLYQYNFGQFKGFIAENVVLTELISGNNDEVYTWRGSTSEIEFVLPSGDSAVPVEVKAGINTKAKSLKVFREKYNPENAVLLSAQGVNNTVDFLIHAPVYLAGKIKY